MKSSRRLNVIVTGANRGLGLSLTQLLLSKGHKVAAVSRSIQNLETIENADLKILQADLNTDEYLKVADELSSGSYTTLINNAAILGKSEFVNSTVEEQYDVLNINLQIPMRLSRVFLKSKVANPGGYLINVCSVAGLPEVDKLEGLAVYSASKAGLIAFSQTVAKEIPPEQCVIIPLIIGSMQTGMLEEAIPGYSEGLSTEIVAEEIVDIIEDQTTVKTGGLHTISTPA